MPVADDEEERTGKIKNTSSPGRSYWRTRTKQTGRAFIRAAANHAKTKIIRRS